MHSPLLQQGLVIVDLPGKQHACFLPEGIY